MKYDGLFCMQFDFLSRECKLTGQNKIDLVNVNK